MVTLFVLGCCFVLQFDFINFLSSFCLFRFIPLCNFELRVIVEFSIVIYVSFCCSSVLILLFFVLVVWFLLVRLSAGLDGL